MDPKIDDLLSSDQQAEYKRVGFNYSPLDISTMVNILAAPYACFRVYLEWHKHYGMCVVCPPLHAFKGPGGLAWLTNYLLDTTSTAPLFTTNRPTMWVLRSILLVRNHPHTIIHAYNLYWSLEMMCTYCYPHAVLYDIQSSIWLCGDTLRWVYRLNSGGISRANRGGEYSIHCHRHRECPHWLTTRPQHSWGLATHSPAILAQLGVPLCGITCSCRLLPSPGSCCRGEASRGPATIPAAGHSLRWYPFWQVYKCTGISIYCLPRWDKNPAVF